MTTKKKEGRTSNYKLFVVSEFNRPLRDRPDLRASMREHGFWSTHPLLVKRKRSKLEIVAGHHRFATAAELGIPVCYRVVNGDMGSDPAGGEWTSKAWTMKDYLHAYCNKGSKHYMKLDEYIDRTGFGLTVSIRLLGSSGIDTGGINASFKRGGFRVGKDLSIANAAEEISKAVAPISPRVGRNTRFIMAVISAMHVPEFDYRRFVSKVDINPGLVMPQPDTDCYLDMIQEIHNYKSRTKPPIAHMAREGARKRKAGK